MEIILKISGQYSPTAGVLWVFRLMGLLQLLPYQFYLATLPLFFTLFGSMTFPLYGEGDWHRQTYVTLTMSAYGLSSLVGSFIYAAILRGKTIKWADGSQTIPTKPKCCAFFGWIPRFTFATIVFLICCTLLAVSAMIPFTTTTVDVVSPTTGEITKHTQKVPIPSDADLDDPKYLKKHGIAADKVNELKGIRTASLIILFVLLVGVGIANAIWQGCSMGLASQVLLYFDSTV